MDTILIVYFRNNNTILRIFNYLLDAEIAN